MIICTYAILQNDALISATCREHGNPKNCIIRKGFFQNERFIPDENLKWGLPPSLFYRIYQDTFPDFQALRCDIPQPAGACPTTAPTDAAQCRTQPGTGRAGQGDLPTTPVTK